MCHMKKEEHFENGSVSSAMHQPCQNITTFVPKLKKSAGIWSTRLVALVEIQGLPPCTCKLREFNLPRSNMAESGQ